MPAANVVMITVVVGADWASLTAVSAVLDVVLHFQSIGFASGGDKVDLRYGDQECAWPLNTPLELEAVDVSLFQVRCTAGYDARITLIGQSR